MSEEFESRVCKVFLPKEQWAAIDALARRTGDDADMELSAYASAAIEEWLMQDKPAPRRADG